ncbi:MAG: zinc ribbon domain-containing protein [Lautropia sp.]|nr:zinc ribbon domain-containing protein [Lautropia sp.]
MALITCPECQRQVSDQAPTCPGCGRPIQNASNSTQGITGGNTADWVKATGIVGAAWVLPKLGKLIFAVIVCGLFFYFLFGGKS